MGYNSNVYQVMIASPGDVATERNIIRQIIAEWNDINSFVRKKVFLPVGWETHSSPEMGSHPQEILNKKMLKNCDLLVGVFGTKVGTKTLKYPSGTIEEIEEHLKAGKPAMLYFYKFEEGNKPEDFDEVQYEKLLKYQKSCQDRGLYESYTNSNNFREKFNRQLQIRINQEEYFNDGVNNINAEIINSNIPTIPDLTKEAKMLLSEMSIDVHGMVLVTNDSVGYSVQANSKNMLTEPKSPKQRALWDSVIEELEKEDLINPEGYNGIYIMTKKGFEIAELIN